MRARSNDEADLAGVVAVEVDEERDAGADVGRADRGEDEPVGEEEHGPGELVGDEERLGEHVRPVDLDGVAPLRLRRGAPATDAAFGVRSNSLCSAPKSPSAKALNWCGSMPVLMTTYGTTRAKRRRNVAGAESAPRRCAWSRATRWSWPRAATASVGSRYSATPGADAERAEPEVGVDQERQHASSRAPTPATATRCTCGRRDASRRSGEHRNRNSSVRRCSRWSCTQPWVQRFCCAL